MITQAEYLSKFSKVKAFCAAKNVTENDLYKAIQCINYANNIEVEMSIKDKKVVFNALDKSSNGVDSGYFDFLNGFKLKN